MISPEFHSAAFLVHLSELWVAIRRACRRFSFLFRPNLCCCMSAFFHSLALLCMYSIQSSNSSSWLDVLSVSFSNEILLTCLILIICAVFLRIFTHFVIFDVLSFLFV